MDTKHQLNGIWGTYPIHGTILCLSSLLPRKFVQQKTK